ncbi:hypothetical protein [Dendronalium sp. ChiSLP03b]|uniref:hypothetical protein n=1 Tax=Dendronalium sp. ChiSLP03b TaxID=3075381 RepID=UPI002AD21DD0|nr:hypothetical protein [Dendronalium sp. ChiSLP03b]MDZ8203858.1 hypothetical protein [Dendronalium sp. ChiSLP03b]
MKRILPLLIWACFTPLSASAQCASPIEDPSFLFQPSSKVSGYWVGEGKTGINQNPSKNVWLGTNPQRATSQNENVRTVVGFPRILNRVDGSSVEPRKYPQWSAIRQTVQLRPNTNYTLTVSLNTSSEIDNRNASDISDGYFGVRSADQKVYQEMKFDTYLVRNLSRKLTLRFRTNDATTYNVFAGFWAKSAKEWIKIYEFRMSSSCPDTE